MIFQPNRTYNFSTYAPTILGASFRRMKVTGIINYRMASKITQVDLIQRQVFPLLPPKTPDAVTDYTYISFQDENGSESVFAYPWIIDTSINQITTMQLLATIYSADETTIAKVRDVLNTMGLTFDLKTTDVIG